MLGVVPAPCDPTGVTGDKIWHVEFHMRADPIHEERGVLSGRSITTEGESIGVFLRADRYGVTFGEFDGSDLC